MNKINNKGFMMAEIIVVAVVIVIALVGLFTTFTRTFIEYERLNEYSQVDSLYASKSVINTLYSDIDSAKKALEDESVNFKEYTVTTNIELEPLFNKYNIKSFYLVKYSDEGFNSLISSLTNNEELKRYVNYLKNNLNLTDGSCEVISILEMQFDSSSNKNQFGYYKFVKNSTSGGGGAGGGGGVIYNPPNKPDIQDTGLVPVVYDTAKNQWKIVQEDEEWYDYDKQKWANAVILKDKNKLNDSDPYIEVDILKTTNGNTPSELDIYAMFVWIPRFSYTIGCNQEGQCLGANQGEIDVKFVSVDQEPDDPGVASGTFPQYIYTDLNNRNPDNWYTHPAFTFNGKQLSGIWVGKFQTSTSSSGCYNAIVKKLNFDSSVDPKVECKGKQIPIILPNYTALIYQNISSQYSTANQIKDYGIAGDIHMTKSSEWSAILYLSRSKYGKFAVSYYNDEKRIVYCNNSTYRYTGRSSNALYCYSVNNTGNYTYDGKAMLSGESNCENCGTGASSSGTIYGVYDLGSYCGEYVMANYKNNSGKSGFSGLPSSEYYDLINPIDDNETYKVLIGHGLKEIRNTNLIFFDEKTWVLRGKYSVNGISNVDGDNWNTSHGCTHSFRISIINYL